MSFQDELRARWVRRHEQEWSERCVWECLAAQTERDKNFYGSKCASLDRQIDKWSMNSTA